MSARRPIVAIDGPAGAGKSTVARGLAKALGFLRIDTGAMYRTVALASERRGVEWSDAAAVEALAHELMASGSVRLSTLADAPGDTGVWLDSEDVSSLIRTPTVGQGASIVSAYAGVRHALLSMQRELGRAGGVVLEGRDIGTVVFPTAEAKFFVTASPEVRARRRYDELRARGVLTSFDQTLADVRARDEADTGRAIAPLVAAQDAEVVDTSGLSIDEVVARLAARVRGLASG